MLNKVRGKVSADRTRFRRDSVDLDLTYIIPNIVAMGFPASGFESAWRNHIDSVVRFLKSEHGARFYVYNLSERSYDYSKFDYHVSY